MTKTKNSKNDKELYSKAIVDQISDYTMIYQPRVMIFAEANRVDILLY